MDVVDAVRGHGEVVGLGDVGDLEPGRHAAHVRNVGLGKCDAAGVDQPLELVDRAEVLARGDREPAGEIPSEARELYRRRPVSSEMYEMSCLKMKRFGAPSRVSRIIRWS